jgi:hypothetical protein
VLPGAAGHLIVASVISVPAALMLAELMVPQGAEQGVTAAAADILIDDPPQSSMDAIAQGTREGIELVVNVTAMLIVIVALVALANQLIAVIGRPFGLGATLEQMLGWLFAPLAWLIGIPWSESTMAGSLLGVKTVLNELIAYLQLAGTSAEALSPPLTPDLDLRALRLCQPGKPWHSDRRHGGDGARAPGRDRKSRRSHAGLGDARHLDDGGSGRRLDARLVPHWRGLAAPMSAPLSAGAWEKCLPRRPWGPRQ